MRVQSDRLFFDHAAVGLLTQQAERELLHYAQTASEQGFIGQDWFKKVHLCRASAARLLGANASEVALIPNTSTGLATVAEGLTWQHGDEVLIPSVEYPANRYCWENLKRLGVELKEVTPDEYGLVTAEKMIQAVTPQTRLIAVSWVQYTNGYVIDLKTLVEQAHARGIQVCADAIQGLGVLPIDVHALGVDYLTAGGHKWLLSPLGTGLLYVRQDRIADVEPTVIGWMNMVDALDYNQYHFELLPDARRFEPGTWNVPGIMALGASLDHFVKLGMNHVWDQIEQVTDHLVKALAVNGFDVLSPRLAGQKSGIVSALPKGISRERGEVELASLEKIQQCLAEQKIIINVRGKALRFSPHYYNTQDQVEALIPSLMQACKQVLA